MTGNVSLGEYRNRLHRGFATARRLFNKRSSTASGPVQGVGLIDHAAVHGTPLDNSKKQIRVLQILPLEAARNKKDKTVHCRMFKVSLNDSDPQPLLPDNVNASESKSTLEHTGNSESQPDPQMGLRLPLFNALSYTWGSPDERMNIVVNGTIVSVTRNLESVLRHLRDHHMHIMCGYPLWVDALCINQEDAEERNAQVQMMGEIYGRAAYVLPWLGEGEGDTDWLIHALRDDDFRTEVAQQASQVEGPEPSQLIFCAVSIFFSDLCSRSWWSRLWIIQEVMLAKRDPILIIGSETVPWSEFVAMFNQLWKIYTRIRHTKEYEAEERSLYITTHPNLPFMATTPLPGIYVPAWNSLRSAIQLDDDGQRELDYVNSLGGLLVGDSNMLNQSATMKADYIYGLLGLLPIKEQGLIDVDYSKPPMAVFQDAMAAVWTSYCSSPWLPRVPIYLQFGQSDISDDDHEIPSWVPDLSQQDWTRGGILHTSAPQPWRDPIGQVSWDKKTLTFRGIYFDAVTETCAVEMKSARHDRFSFDEPDSADLRRAVRCIIKAIRREPPPSSVVHALGGLRDPEQDASNIMRTLMHFTMLDSVSEQEWLVDTMAKMLLEMADVDCDFSFSRLYKYAEEQLQQRSIGLTAEYCVSRLSVALNSRIRGNVVFGTKAGSAGVGPGHMRAGDRLVFPFGMYAPFAVRPLDPEHPETHEYTFIGSVEIPDVSDHQKELDKAFEDGLLEEIEIHLK